ncbi:hypothetical protein [Fluviicola sp.]|uniref:M61 family metallopeptidase n=1 Tax=Fluviicola sp. TaxID=1917219 RepID=UPI0031CF6A8C
MKRAILIFLLIICALSGQAVHAQITYRYETSLKDLSGDKLAVHLKISGFSADTLTYCFPKIIPGIYGAMNFGQYIPPSKSSIKKEKN